MKPLSERELRLAIHMTHNCSATKLLATYNLTIPGYTSDTEVFLFAVHDHPTATRCFVWQEHFNKITSAIAVLCSDEIETASDAVRRHFNSEHTILSKLN